MLFDGEKFACEACVRGHRVSSCNHHDRPLHQINKKGRPVSQCQHCRGARKSRSSHVKCDCGDKAGPNAGNLQGDSAREHCSCVHDHRCTCATKTNQVKSIPDIPPAAKGRSRANTDSKKPRLPTNRSEPIVMTVGHPKMQRHNHASKDCAPYKLPRPHSIHGPSSSAYRSHEDLTSPLQQAAARPARFLNTMSHVVQDGQRLVPSAQASPGQNPLAGFDFGHLPPLDLSYTAYNTSLTNSPEPDHQSQLFQAFDTYGSSDHGRAPLSAPLTGPNHAWTALDLPLGGDTFNSAPSKPQSYESLDQTHPSQPGFTSAASTDVSELGDLAVQGVQDTISAQSSAYGEQPSEYMPLNLGQPLYHQSTESFPFGPANIALNQAMEESSLEAYPLSLHGSPLDPNELSSCIHPDFDAFARHGLTVQDAQKLAHPGGVAEPVMAPPASVPTPITPTSDPLWSTTYTATGDDVDFPGSNFIGQEYPGHTF